MTKPVLSRDEVPVRRRALALDIGTWDLLRRAKAYAQELEVVEPCRTVELQAGRCHPQVLAKLDAWLDEQEAAVGSKGEQWQR